MHLSFVCVASHLSVYVPRCLYMEMGVCSHRHAKITENVKPPKLSPVGGWEYLWVCGGRMKVEHPFSASYLIL